MELSCKLMGLSDSTIALPSPSGSMVLFSPWVPGLNSANPLACSAHSMLKLLVNSLFFNLHINLAFRWVTNTHLLRLHCANACPSLLCFLASDDHSDHSCPCTYPPLYKHTKRSFESIQKIMPLLCYKLPSKCHGSQKNIQSWFWGRCHVGWGPCTLCLCFFFMFVSLSLHLHSLHPSNRSGQWFFPQPGIPFPSLCKVFYFLDRKLIETLLLLPLVPSPFPGGRGWGDVEARTQT